MRMDHMIRGPRAGLGETSCSAVTMVETSKQRESMLQPELGVCRKMESSLEKGCAGAQRLKSRGEDR